MNAIERFGDVLRLRLPAVEVALDRPAGESAAWFLDARLGERGLVIEWRPGVGFGLTVDRDSFYGDALPDEFFRDANTALERVVHFLSDEAATSAHAGA